MSGSAPEAPADTSASPTPSAPTSAPRSLVTDALIVFGWFAVAGVIGALVWWQATPLPKVRKTAEGAVYDNNALVSQVGIDGWFFVIALVLGLVSGVVLLAWRSRNPVLMVLLVALGAGLASWLMIHLGLALGPGEETAALSGAPNGTRVSMQLDLHATGVAWIWPIAALLGALVQLWVLRKPDGEPDD